MLDEAYLQYIKNLAEKPKKFRYRNSHRTIEGYQIERSIEKHPYTYTRFCVYKNEWKPTDTLVYSDRLHLWFDNYDELKEKYLGRGDYFTAYEPDMIENFLSILFEQKLLLTGIEQECNCFNGYPYWLLYYREVDK